MTEEEARAILERAVAWEAHPILTEADIDELLIAARIADADGLLPDDEDWAPTWDLNGAAADGWERKAGLVAGDYDFGEDGQRFNRSQVHAMCLVQADRFDGRRSSRSSFRAVTLQSPYGGAAGDGATSLLDFGDS